MAVSFLLFKELIIYILLQSSFDATHPTPTHPIPEMPSFLLKVHYASSSHPGLLPIILLLLLRLMMMLFPKKSLLLFWRLIQTFVVRTVMKEALFMHMPSGRQSRQLIRSCRVSRSQKTSKSHFTIGSDPIKSKALYYHYLDLPILRTSADLKYYHSHLVDFFLIVLHLSDHVIIGCRHPGCLTAEYTFIFIAIFSYLLCFTFSSVLKSVLPFVLVQF